MERRGRLACDLIKLTKVRTSRVVPPAAPTMPQSGLHPDRSPDGVWPARWAFLASPPLDGVTNMAIDAALLDMVAEGDGTAVWRCYAWAQPTVSFGRNERTTGRFSDQSVRAAGLTAVRRPTGGRA